MKKTGHGLLFYEGFSVFCFPRETLSSFCLFLIHINWRFQMNLTVARLLWDVLSKLICSFFRRFFWGKMELAKIKISKSEKNILKWTFQDFKFPIFLFSFWIKIFLFSRERTCRKFFKSYILLLRTCLVDYNSNYIRIGICVTRNTRYCNIIFIVIHLFGNNTIIEP